ncbi:probable ATP-dependent RNA helicase YTHDC2 [Lingula anatina]|uniref:Probable ATP-dependent RNA helicase YTHDC2 n=1 Tax=Lingula anatina TaxID=7574 RepID=A0A1S3J6R1_LINAN|nr:probable ATP-dependent RNA helicase YTHDC2 [Lingula anatina]|eukprot:XP_013405941.1 probable ATP-dependent RNA helicase YTHDC2 [Lingula anatina]
MIKYKSELEKVAEQQRHLDQWCNQQPSAERAEPEESVLEDSGVIEDRDDGIEVDKLGPEKEELEPWLVTEMDKLLTEAWLTGEEDIFTQIFHLIMSEDVTVDYMHSETSATPLMIAAARGFTSVVEQLLNLGANIKIKASNGWNALNWAEKFERADVIEILKAYMTTSEEGEEGDDEDLLKETEMTVSEEDKQLLNLYHHSFDDDKVDTDLILALLHKIQDSQEEGEFCMETLVWLMAVKAGSLVKFV